MYEPFLKQLHSQSKYLDNAETAIVVADFLKSTKDKIHEHEKLKPSGSMTVSYKVLEQKKSPVLCENYHFTTIGAFLGMEEKVCRDVGHRKKYADKVKNDPIWLAYVRAYKQHYSRFLKKRITQAEFQQWADYALELRQKAINGEMSLEEYCEIIKK